jgi:hypothetical protein
MWAQTALQNGNDWTGYKSNMQEREVTQNTFQNIPRYDKQFVSLLLLIPNLVTQWLGFLLQIQESHEGLCHETLHRFSLSCLLYVQNVKTVAVLLKFILPNQRTKHTLMYVLHSQWPNIWKVNHLQNFLLVKCHRHIKFTMRNSSVQLLT